MQATPPSMPWSSHLPDQHTQILAFLATWIALYADVRAFVEARAQLEREYGTKLQAITRKLAERRDRRLSALCVGDEPSKGWDTGHESKHTFVTALGQHLSSLEHTASEHLKLADQLQSQVIDELKRAEKKKEDNRKKLQSYVQQVVEDRDKLYYTREKAKTKYHESCTESDAARLKLDKLPAGDRHEDRYKRSYKKSVTDMRNAKNDYLLSIKVANEAKKRFYVVDMPGITGELQTAHAASEERLAFLLSHTATIYIGTYSSLSTHTQAITRWYEPLDVEKDEDMYADYNVRTFAPPPDWTWEPCPTYYADDRMELGEPGHGEDEMTYLQNRLARSRAESEKLLVTMSTQRQEIIASRELITSYSLNRGLGDPDDVVDTMLTTMRDMTALAMKQEALAAEISTLEAFLGDDQGSGHAHDFKPASFTIPTPCDSCKSSIWGISKGGSTCRRCGANVHQKCELKIPANCRSSGISHDEPPKNRRTSVLGRKPSSSASSLTSIVTALPRGHNRAQSAGNPSGPPSAVDGAHPHGITSPTSPPGMSTSSTMQNFRNSFIQRRRSDQPQGAGPAASDSGHTALHLPPPHALGQSDYDMYPIVQGPGSQAGSSYPSSMTNSRRQSHEQSGTPARSGRSPRIEEEATVLQPPAQSGSGQQAGGMSGMLSAVVLWDFVATDEEEISIRKGETVFVIDQDEGDGWIKVAARNGSEEGLVPAEYVSINANGAANGAPPSRPQPAAYATNPSSTTSSSRSSSYEHAQPAPPPAFIQPQRRAGNGSVRALYDYTAAEDDEVSLVKGRTYALSTVGQMYGDGWWEIERENGQTGIAPANYLAVI